MDQILRLSLISTLIDLGYPDIVLALGLQLLVMSTSTATLVTNLVCAITAGGVYYLVPVVHCGVISRIWYNISKSVGGKNGADESARTSMLKERSDLNRNNQKENVDQSSVNGGRSNPGSQKSVIQVSSTLAVKSPGGAKGLKDSRSDEFLLFGRVDFAFLFENVKYERSVARYACIIKMIHYALLSLTIAVFYDTPKLQMISFVAIKLTYIGVIVVQPHLKSRVNYIFEVVNESLYTFASTMMTLLVVFDETQISPEARYLYIGYCICATICVIMFINIVKMLIETVVMIFEGLKFLISKARNQIYHKQTGQVADSTAAKRLPQ
jgi:hypothetical protein